MMGMITFGAVAIGLHVTGVKVADPGMEFLPWLFIAMSLPIITVTQFVASQQKNRPFPKDEPLANVLGAYQSGSLIGWAGLEGAAFMNLVGFLMTGKFLSLVIPGIALAWMAFTFPTRFSIENWVRTKELESI
jgi:hypothetical protein